MLWKEIDEDKSGDRVRQYVPMHRRCCEIMVLLTKMRSSRPGKSECGHGFAAQTLMRDGCINHEEHEN